MTVTTRECDEEGFTFKWISVGDGLAGIGLSRTYGPSFVPDPGSTYSLTPPNNSSLFRRLTEDGPC